MGRQQWQIQIVALLVPVVNIEVRLIRGKIRGITLWVPHLPWGFVVLSQNILLGSGGISMMTFGRQKRGRTAEIDDGLELGNRDTVYVIGRHITKVVQSFGLLTKEIS